MRRMPSRNALATQCAKQSCHTTIHRQPEQLHNRAELILVHVDVPLRDLNE
jgi:hypothetical protein